MFFRILAYRRDARSNQPARKVRQTPKQARLYGRAEPENFALGVKEVLALPREETERRFALTGDEGADFEILGATGDIPGGGFLYTNRDTVSIGVVLQLPGLACSKRRPEAVIAELKRSSAIAPLVDGGELKEHVAHLIPEGGFRMMPKLASQGFMVAGDAAGLCLAAGIWLEGMNYAIGSGMAPSLRQSATSQRLSSTS